MFKAQQFLTHTHTQKSNLLDGVSTMTLGDEKKMLPI